MHIVSCAACREDIWHPTVGSTMYTTCYVQFGAACSQSDSNVVDNVVSHDATAR